MWQRGPKHFGFWPSAGTPRVVDIQVRAASRPSPVFTGSHLHGNHSFMRVQSTQMKYSSVFLPVLLDASVSPEPVPMVGITACIDVF